MSIAFNLIINRKFDLIGSFVKRASPLSPKSTGYAARLPSLMRALEQRFLFDGAALIDGFEVVTAEKVTDPTVSNTTTDSIASDTRSLSSDATTGSAFVDKSSTSTTTNETTSETPLSSEAQASLVGSTSTSDNKTLSGDAATVPTTVDVSVFKWFETDGVISSRRDWLNGFKV